MWPHSLVGSPAVLQGGGCLQAQGHQAVQGSAEVQGVVASRQPRIKGRKLANAVSRTTKGGEGGFHE